jgi:hypothetical protein
MGAVFMGGMQKAFSTGWRDAAKPLLTDYMPTGWWPTSARRPTWRARRRWRAAADLHPHRRPQVNWESHPGPQPRRLDARPRRDSDKWLSRTTADGHRVIFGPAPFSGSAPHGMFGWITLALLLGVLLAPMPMCAACCARWTTSRRRRALRPRRVRQPIPLRRRDDLGDLAGASTPWRTTSRPCSTPSAGCCWR